MKIWIAVLIFLLLTSAHALSQGKPLLHMENLNRDAGTVEQGDEIRQIFAFSNRGSGILHILDVSHS